MRCALWVMAVSASCLPLGGSPPRAAAAPPEKKILLNDAHQIADTLLERFDIAQRLEGIKLKDVLALVEERVGVAVILDVNSLAGGAGMVADGNALKDYEAREITVPAMKKVRVETVLKFICDQINAVYVIEADHIRITSSAAKEHLTGDSALIPSITGSDAGEGSQVSREERIRLAPTVTVSFDQKTLAEAAKALADRGGRNLILAASALPKENAKVSFSLTNVTFETAAVALAEAAGLRAVKQGNVVVLVTPERFKEINPAPAAGPNGFQMGLGALSIQDLEAIARLMGGKAPDADSLKKDIEKLKQERDAAEVARKELVTKIEQLKEELNKKK